MEVIVFVCFAYTNRSKNIHIPYSSRSESHSGPRNDDLNNLAIAAGNVLIGLMKHLMYMEIKIAQ